MEAKCQDEKAPYNGWRISSRIQHPGVVLDLQKERGWRLVCIKATIQSETTKIQKSIRKTAVGNELLRECLRPEEKPSLQEKTLEKKKAGKGRCERQRYSKEGLIKAAPEQTLSNRWSRPYWTRPQMQTMWRCPWDDPAQKNSMIQADMKHHNQVARIVYNYIWRELFGNPKVKTGNTSKGS